MSAPEWYDTEEIGGWLKLLPGAVRLRTVREHAHDPNLWEPGHFDLDWGREALTRLITEAGGIRSEFALEAQVKGIGPIMLTNGVHRWERATALCIARLPVDVTTIPPARPMTNWG